jgi:hypothetical protein
MISKTGHFFTLIKNHSVWFDYNQFMFIIMNKLNETIEWWVHFINVFQNDVILFIFYYYFMFVFYLLFIIESNQTNVFNQIVIEC